MRITIKEVDRLFSKLHKNKVVSEYLIYVDINDTGHHIKAYSEIGEAAKKMRVNELILDYYPYNNITLNDVELIETSLDNL